jgi:hypothetical protein
VFIGLTGTRLEINGIELISEFFTFYLYANNHTSTKDSLTALMRADFTTQWRNRRSAIMAILVPIIILISWKGIAEKAGAVFVFQMPSLLV